MKPEATRLIDATATECVLSARRPVEAGTLRALDGPFPLQAIASAVPVLPPGAYGATDLAPLQVNAAVLEPLTWPAHAAILAAVHADRPPAVLVDPVGFVLGDAPAPDVSVPDGWTRECVAWLPDAAEEVEAWTERIAAALERLPDGARLRLRDPAAHLGPQEVTALLTLREADRLVLVPEDTRGLALATALLALDAPHGPRVRSTVLGIGPRSGLAPTELLAPTLDLGPAAQAAALIAGISVPPQHPLWGHRRNEAPEPETLDRPGAEPRWNPATAPVLLRRNLHELGIRPDSETFDRLLTRLLATLRPGDPLDGATLYAFLATHIDLTRYVTSADTSEGDDR